MSVIEGYSAPHFDPRIPLPSPDRSDDGGDTNSSQSANTGSQVPHTTLALTVEQTIRNTRARLEQHLQDNAANSDETVQLAADVVNIPCPLGMKYTKLDFPDLLKRNTAVKGQEALPTLASALGILAKYGRNLLRENKPAVWRCVRFSNAVFNQKVDIIEGARDILKLLGYTKDIEDGLAYPDEVEAPNMEEVTKLTADLIIAKHEVDCLRTNSHPNPDSTKQYMGGQVKSAQQMLRRQPSGTLPPKALAAGAIALPGMVPGALGIKRPPVEAIKSTPPPPQEQEQTLTRKEEQGPAKDAEQTQSAGQANLKPAVSSSSAIASSGLVTDGLNSTSPGSSMSSDPDTTYLKKPEDFVVSRHGLLSPGAPVRPSTLLPSTTAGPVSPYQMMAPSPLSPKPAQPKRSPSEPQFPLRKVLDEEKLCDLCGEEAATKACETCGDKRCDECDERWHKHAARRDHKRTQIIPSPTTPSRRSYENFERREIQADDTTGRSITKSQSDPSLLSVKKPIPAPRSKRLESLPEGSTLSSGLTTLSQTLPRTSSANFSENMEVKSQTLPRKPPTPPRPATRPDQHYGQFAPSVNGPTAYPPQGQSNTLIESTPYPAFFEPKRRKILSPEEEKRLKLTHELKTIDIEVARREIEEICLQLSRLSTSDPAAKQSTQYQELEHSMKFKMKGLEEFMQELEDINNQLAEHQAEKRAFMSDARHMNHSLPPTVTRPPNDLHWSHEGQPAARDKGIAASMYYPMAGMQHGSVNAPQMQQIPQYGAYDHMVSGPADRLGAPPPYSQFPHPHGGVESGQMKHGAEQRFANMSPHMPGANMCDGCGHYNLHDSKRCAKCFNTLSVTDRVNFTSSHQPPAYNFLRADSGQAASPLVQPPVVVPQPSKAEDRLAGNQAWACEHCTFLNTDPNTRICSICDKTSLSIPLKKKPEIKPKPTLEHRSFAAATDSPPSPVPKAAGNSTTEPADNVPQRFVHMQEEQEQVVKEKLQAKKEWEERLKKEEEEMKAAKEKGIEAPVKAPDPANFLLREAAKPAIPDKPVFDRPQTKPNKIDISKWEQGRVDELNRDKDQLQQTWQKQDLMAQDLREKKLLEEQRTDGLKFVTVLREAEAFEFEAEELEMAMNFAENGDPLKWLKEQWPNRIETVAAMVTNHREGGGLGEASIHEAKEALKRHNGNVEKAVEECVNQRRKKIDEILDLGNFSRDNAGEALKRNKGDVDKALVDLQQQIVQPFLDRLWQLSDGSSGIHQTRANDKNVEHEIRVRLVLAEYTMPSWGRAETAIKLVDMGKYDTEDAIIAAKECGTLQRAKEFLEKECEICYATVSMNKLVTLFHCQCKMCKECMVDYFRIQIREKNIRQCVCPVCGLPDMEDAEIAEQYFQFLDNVVQYYFEEEIYTLYQQKLRDMNLMKDPNFRWCSICDFGFLNENPNRKKMHCPECKQLTCFDCKKPWLDQHEGISCEAFQAWKEANDPDRQAAGLAAHLKENGIDCPNCKFRYALAKGGCMHFKCTQCRHEFCSGCYKPFKTKCNQFKSCSKKGLHAHHPRNCLFYLRDENIEDLQKLLKDHNVAFDTEAPQQNAEAANQQEEGAAAALPPAGKCRVEEQKETTDGLKDDFCGRETMPGYAGLCKIHYSEYLVELIKNKQIDPAVMFKADTLSTILKRNEIKVPDRKKDTIAQYTHRLLELVQQRLPLQEPR